MNQPKTKSPPCGPATPTDCRDHYSDDDFHKEYPDEDAARNWFAGIYYPNGVRCSTCWCCKVTELGTASGANPTHRCNHCQQDFSMATGTLLEGLDVSYREWLWALRIFTAGAHLPAPRTLATEIGWADRKARDATYRLLQAAAESPVRLREPAELDCSFLHHSGEDGIPGKSVVIALVGRRSGRVAGLRHIQDEKKPTIQKFVREHLVEGMTLFADTHGSNRDIPETVQYFVNHYKGRFTNGPASINRTEGVWPRLKRVLHADYSWYRDHCLGHWLDGVRWRENHRRLSHLDRMKTLALGMRWKPPDLTRDHYAIQRTMDQEHNQTCGDCRNVCCLTQAKTPVWTDHLARANPYCARRMA